MKNFKAMTLALGLISVSIVSAHAQDSGTISQREVTISVRFPDGSELTDQKLVKQIRESALKQFDSKDFQLNTPYISRQTYRTKGDSSRDLDVNQSDVIKTEVQAAADPIGDDFETLQCVFTLEKNQKGEFEVTSAGCEI